MKTAIVNTIEMENFPERGVYLFDTEADATKFMVDSISKIHPPDPGQADEAVIHDFQFGLGPIDYFHSFPVAAISASVNELVSACRLLFNQIAEGLTQVFEEPADNGQPIESAMELIEKALAKFKESKSAV